MKIINIGHHHPIVDNIICHMPQWNWKKSSDILVNANDLLGQLQKYSKPETSS